MKKCILGFMVLFLCFACSQDEVITADIDTATLTSESNFEAINPITTSPNRSFDALSEGMYHGIMVTEDISVHGKIWINVGNDGQYNATVITDEGERLSFFAKTLDLNPTHFVFEGKRGSFRFDVSDFNHPVATNVIIDETVGFIQTIKDRSTQRAVATLGTYVDFADPTFTGTWDLITDGTPGINFVGTDTSTPIVLPLLTQVCILGPGGAMFVDDTFEPYDYPCVGGVGFPPVFYHTDASADPTDPTSANEFWAQNQVLDVVGAPLNYFLGQSSVLSIFNNSANTGFHNEAFDGTGTLGCNGFTDLQGIWFWNGRVGSANFTDPFDFVPPPPLTDSQLNAEGLIQAQAPTSTFETAILQEFNP